MLISFLNPDYRFFRCYPLSSKYFLLRTREITNNITFIVNVDANNANNNLNSLYLFNMKTFTSEYIASEKTIFPIEKTD